MKDNQKKLPLDIQLFAEGGEQSPAVAAGQNATTQNTSSVGIDYEKIQGMIDSRNQRTEDSILKSYFQNEGLSQEEAKEAIKTYKSQKEENENRKIVESQNVQTELDKVKTELLKSHIEREAFISAIDLGVDTKTAPYLIKMADFDNVTDEKGEIDKDKVKEAINKVLTDIPGLKVKEEAGTAGVKVGVDSSNSDVTPNGNIFNFGFTGVRNKK